MSVIISRRPVGVSKLSQLEIDTDKDWRWNRIYNVSELGVDTIRTPTPHLHLSMVSSVVFDTNDVGISMVGGQPLAVTLYGGLTVTDDFYAGSVNTGRLWREEGDIVVEALGRVDLHACGGVVPKYYEQDTEPEIPANCFAFWRNPSSGETWLIYHNGTEQKKVKLDQ